MRRAYVNGVIYTMKEENDVCSAFVEEDGNFIYCGTDEEAARIADVVIDLNGKTVLPGLTDTHQHLLAYSRDLHKLNLKDVTSAEELKQRIREKASTLKKGEWIQGAGFDNEKFTDCKDMPTKHLLDEAAPDNPVLLTRYCLHINVANSLALEAGGVDRDFVPEVDGTVGYDPDGEPNGIVLDQVAADISALIPDPNADYESQKKAVEDACRELNKVGLIGVHPIQAKHIDLFEKMSIYQDLEKEGRLTARVYLGLDEPPGMNMRRGLGSSMVKYGFYKLFTDGSLGARSAYLKEPYTDDPSQIGVTIYSQEELDRKVREGYEADLQVGVHVIGDRSVEMLVEAIEKAYYANPKPNVRFRMIHMSLLNDDIIERIRKLPVIVDIQPMFIVTNIRWADGRIGYDRAEYLYCWKKLIDAGVMITGGSDSPIESFNPFYGVYALVNRQDFDGYPEGGWHPDNRISVYDALCIYCKNAAYDSYEEDVRGTIEEGKYADFIVIDRDIFRIPHREIKDIRVEETYLGGKRVYSK